MAFHESRSMKTPGISSGSFFDPQKIIFSMFTSEEMKALSAVKIQTPLTLNTLGHPVQGGLYDPAMGPLNEHSDPCKTCFKNIYGCPGHMGHIELPLPVSNPMFHKPLAVLMKMACLSCHRLQLSPLVKWQIIAQLQLVDVGCITEALEIETNTSDGTDMSTVHSDVQEAIAKERMCNYVEKVLKEKAHILSSSPSKASESVRNITMNSLLRDAGASHTCIYCKSPITKITVFRDRLTQNVKVEVAPKHQQGDESLLNQSTASTASSSKPGKYGTAIKMQTVTLNPREIRDHMRQVWSNEKTFISEIMPVLKGRSLECPTDLFFFDVIPVPPPNVRPVNMLNGQPCEHPQTSLYKKVVTDALVLWNVIQLVKDGSGEMLSVEGKLLTQGIQGNTPIEKLHFAWEQLQTSADRLLDCVQVPGASSHVQGLKQVLEKKEGVIRMHMMGKRVNYAARSVITPDPNLNVDEIGFPEAFALKLTYPVPVTPWNVKELRRMVQNGPKVHPGAVMVEDENGCINRLNEDDPLQRESIAKRLLTPGEEAKKVSRGMKKVYRHLVNGDILLLNRQPTLHRPSIMAHKARILKGEKTLRMHYSNCKSYNADFDGDEMNAHFPQSELARSEAYNLVSVCHQYLVPKDGTPLGGLIQDHMVSGVRLSIRGKFFTREDYCQLVYQSISDQSGDIRLLPPAILKPMPLWSGKQVISTVLINTIPRGKHLINLTATAKIRANAWEKQKPRPWKGGGTPFKNASTMSEAEVIIRQGELLCGVLDKTHYGATPYGLVHCMYELYGGVCSSRVLSAFAKLFMAFLQLMQGFTLGVEDILVVKEADERRSQIVKECRKIGDTAVAAALHLPPNTSAEVLTSKMEEAYNNTKINFRGEVDRQFKVALNAFTDEINKTCLPAGLLQQFPDNNLQLMVQSGAKGSTVNTMQISCLLGQIELEGKRPPLMISGRSLPSFRPYDRQPRAGGFIDGRFMTGIQPQEFFFHCMAGREGLIDTAVKTSRSGYLQRCLVKNLEGLSIHYDMTVRDSDGSVVQFAYGEDGMDISKVQFLKSEQMPFLEENYKVILDQHLVSTLKDDENRKVISKQKKAVKKWKKSHGSDDRVRKSTFLNYSAAMQSSFPITKISKDTGRKKGTEQLIELFRETPADDPEMKKFNVESRCPDPVAAVYPASSHFGVLTEHLENMVDAYINNHERKTGSVDENAFRDMLYLKSMVSLAPAGDPVGLLAAQSVGEPSTQMTLNTFHFAGRGEMNVTLGIPRLKEILMTASKNISTPSMEIPFRKDVHKINKKAENLKGLLTRITVADVLEYVQVTESLVLSPQRVHQYVMKMQFLPQEVYKEDYCVSPKQIMKHVEKYFLDSLHSNIRKLTKTYGQTISIENQVKKSLNQSLDGEKDEEHVEREDIVSMEQKLGAVGGNESSGGESEGDDEDARTVMRRKEQNDSANDSDGSDAESDDKSDEEMKNNPVFEDERENDLRQLYGDAEVRQSYVVGKYQFIEEYNYDLKKEEWCIVKIRIPIRFRKINLSTLIQEVAQVSVVWQVPGLKRAFLLDHPQKGLTLKTDGLNIIEMFRYNNLLDLNRLYTNDIHAIADTYGIEAAGRVIVKEIQDVFKVYGITVDPRHLMLIADFMTFSGTFQPMSRTGMDTNPSPLQKMSFEAPVIFLKKAIWSGKTDSLDSPSSRICIGRPCKSGTGAFQLLHQLQVK